MNNYNVSTVDDAQQTWAEILKYGKQPYPLGAGIGVHYPTPTPVLRLDGKLAQVVKVNPTDRQVCAGCGVTLDKLMMELELAGLELPAVVFNPEVITLGGWIGSGMSGSKGQNQPSRRLLAATMITTQGRLIHSGASTPKDVAGYDFHRPLVGAYGSLGILLEVTLLVDAITSERIIYRLETEKLADLWKILDRTSTVVYVWVGFAEGYEKCIFVEFEGSTSATEFDRLSIATTSVMHRINIPSSTFWQQALTQAFSKEGYYEQRILPKGEAQKKIITGEWWGNYWEGKLWRYIGSTPNQQEKSSLPLIMLRHGTQLSPLQDTIPVPVRVYKNIV